MTEIFTLPRVQVFDSNGDPLAGAKLETYEAGTTTPLATYSDDDLSVANANPVVADASGRFAAIFLKPQNYKFVLKNAANVTIWTADDIAGGPNGTFSLSDNGAALGPEVILDRHSDNPAAADIMGGVSFKGRDSGGGTDVYARIQAEIVDPASGSEDGRLAFRTAVAGALATRMRIEQHVIVDSSLYMGTKLLAGWELISETTVSVAAAQVDIITGMDATYDEYAIVFLAVKPETDDVSFHARVNNGSGFASSGHRYLAGIQVGPATPAISAYGSGTSGDNTSANIALSRIGVGNGVGTATGEHITGVLYLTNPDSLTEQFLCPFHMVYVRSDGVICRVDGVGNYDGVGDDVIGFRFFFSSGNIEAGAVFRLLGRRKA